MIDDGDKLDDMIDGAAREYNRAPETPRAEMWERIQAARSRTAATAVTPLRAPVAHDVAAPSSSPDIISIRGRRYRPLWWAAGLAAALLLGVVIGRGSLNTADPRLASTEPTRTVAQTPPVVRESSVAIPSAAATTPPGGKARDDGQRVSAATNGSPRTGEQSPNGTRGVAAEAVATGYKRGAELAAERRAAEVALPYRLAAAEHLAMTEALLVSLRADMNSGRRDTTVASWATNLLGTTRMLLDSPASKDIPMKKLLEDLELVLAQIARLPAASGDSTDLELIDKAVKQRQVLTRLRAIGPRT